MVKIKPVQNIKVIISNDINEIVLNAERPTAEIKGNNYTVKSNCDTMIYFYGKLFKNLKQIKIDPNQKGKYIAITSKKSLSYIIDKGFEGYNPLNIEYFLRNPKFKNKIIYIENIYEKMKNNLVKNEGIYLYYFYQKDHKHYYGDEEWPLDDDSYEEFDLKNNSNNYFYNNFLNNENEDIDIAYYDSLCNPNNDYTFTVIPSNSEGKSLIINNRNEREEDKSKIFYQVNFCGDSSNITMFYEYILSSFSPIKYTGMFNFTEDNTYYQGEIYNSIVKVDFKSNEKFVFSYSFTDINDEDYLNNGGWNRERTELTNLTIINVSEKNIDGNNLLSITFNPNYKYSTTKYIIVISSKNEQNTIKNFSNPCFIAKLVNDKQDGVKIQSWFDSGLTDTITSEIEINDVINMENNNYIVGIISQELRYEKKIRFYSPLEFSIEKKRRKNEPDEGKNVSKILAIVLPIVGCILIVGIILVICNLRKKKPNEVSLNIENNEKLLSDLIY